MAELIEDRARFDYVRYANVWEDPRLLLAGLPTGPGKRLLSIASAGDNALALLATGADVVAADLSPAQLACVELRRAAIRQLEREAFLDFAGLRPAAGGQRLDTFERLAPDLPVEARQYWRRQEQALAGGFVHAGKFERYFQRFRTRILPWVHGQQAVAELLTERDRGGRESFYAERWDNWRWRLLFRAFFSRFVMGRLGRDPEFFRYVEGSVSERILERTRYALTALPTHDNPWLTYILTGTFAEALPHYLQPAVYPRVRANLDRLSCALGAIQEVGAAQRGEGFDGFNLSDLFEYLSPEVGRGLYAALLALARPGARFAYWNMLAPRAFAPEFPDRVVSLEEEARELHARDRAWFYSRFVLEEVTGAPASPAAEAP